MWRRFRKALGGQLDELALAVGLGLVTVGLWPSIGLLALVVPGAVIVWIVLPARGPFMARPPAPRAREKNGT